MMSERPIVVVTGASAGAGRATVRAFAERGFDVALLARGRAGLEGAAAEVEGAGGRAICLPTDVAEWAQVRAAARRVEEELGPIEVWVNSAMTTVFAWFDDVRPEEFRRATEVTYLGQVHGTMAALELMKPRDRGRIVNVGSALSYVGIPLQAAYCGAKFACRGFFESVHAELLAQGSNVAISMVHLPAVNTPQFDWCLSRLPNKPQPVPPIYPPETAAKFIVRAATDGRRSKIVGSWNKVVVGGAKFAPAVLSEFVARTAVSGQQTPEPVAPDRAANLFEPVDRDGDHGAAGSFTEQDRGFWTPSFLESLPNTARTAAEAAVAAARHKVRSFASSSAVARRGGRPTRGDST